MAEFTPFSHLREIQKRMRELAVRLDISTQMPDEKIWEMIGKALAHKEREFLDYPFMPGYEALKGKGRRTSRVNKNVLLALDIAAHRRSNPHLDNERAAILDMRSKGILPTTTTLGRQEGSASDGRKIIQVQVQQLEEQWLKRVAEDAELLKSAAQTRHLRRRGKPASEK